MLRAIVVRVSGMLHDFNIRIEYENIKLLFVKTVVLFPVPVFVLIPVAFNNTILLEKSICEPRIQYFPAGIIFGENKIYIIRSLFSSFHIFRTSWSERNHLVTTGKHSHQRRFDPFNGIHNGRVYVLTSPIHLVTQRHTIIVFHRQFTLLIDGIVVTKSVSDLAIDSLDQFSVRYFIR